MKSELLTCICHVAPVRDEEPPHSRRGPARLGDLSGGMPLDPIRAIGATSTVSRRALRPRDHYISVAVGAL